MNKQTGNRPGPGRPKGSKNKITSQIKDMIVQALENKGGVEYLEKQADANPTAFMGLIGKVLPMQVTGEDGGPITVTIKQFVLNDGPAE